MQTLNRWVRGGLAIFDQDAAGWGLSRRQALALAAIPVLFIAAMIATVPFFELFQWLIEEDLLIEWMQFAGVLAASLMYGALGIYLLGRRMRLAGLLSFLLAVGLFFIAGEEIAWGQRIFGWATPEALEAINVQQETTLHNVSSLHTLFVNGVMLGGLAAALLPMVWWAFRRGTAGTPLTWLAVPPLCLAPAFIMPFGYRFIRLATPLDALYPRLAYPITKFSEVTELCLYFGLAVFAWLTLRQFTRRRVPGGMATPQAIVTPETATGQD